MVAGAGDERRSVYDVQGVSVAQGCRLAGGFVWPEMAATSGIVRSLVSWSGTVSLGTGNTMPNGEDNA